MSSKIVIENIKYFLNEILPNANTRSNWNTDSVERALKWAVYCTKVYDSCADKQLAVQVNEVLEESLSNNILKFESYLQSLGNSPLQLLKCAPDILCKMLFENPHLDESSLQCVITFCLESAEPVLQSKEFLEFVCKKANNVILLNSLENIYSHIVLNNEDKDIKSAVFAANFCIFVILRNEFKDEKIFEMLEKLSSRMDIILYMLIANYTDNFENIKWIQGIVLSWIIENSERLSSKLWTQSSKLLCRISAEHYKFYELYVQFLIQECNSLFPEGTLQDHSWKNRHKAESQVFFSYEDITQRFIELATFSDTLCKVTQDLLTSLCISSGCGVWINVKTQVCAKVNT